MTNFLDRSGVTEVGGRPIWDEAPHNAFTDLVRFNQRWFCTFREGRDHISDDGSIRIITSEDGKDWESAAEIDNQHADLRDPGLSETPDGRLMLNYGMTWHENKHDRRRSAVRFSEIGSSWSEPVPVGDPGIWMWRMTWNEGSLYSVGYKPTAPRLVRLYRSEDASQFETLVDTLYGRNFPNEATVRFGDDETAYCLLRLHREEDYTSLLGRSRQPYRNWEWTDLSICLGGPNMIQLPGGTWIAGGRWSKDGERKTVLFELDTGEGRLTPNVVLESGGDNSYPGLVVRNNGLWVSYYSSHEDRKAKIYLSRIPIKKFL